MIVLTCKTRAPFDLPIHSCAECFIVVGSETYIKDRSAVLEFPYESTRSFAVAVSLI